MYCYNLFITYDNNINCKVDNYNLSTISLCYVRQVCNLIFYKVVVINPHFVHIFFNRKKYIFTS